MTLETMRKRQKAKLGYEARRFSLRGMARGMGVVGTR